MNATFKKIFDDKIIFIGSLIALFFISLYLFITMVSYKLLPPLIPLFNQKPWGDGRIGNKVEIFIPTFVSILIFIFNLFVSKIFYEKNPLVARILFTTSLLVSFFAFVFILKVIFLVL